MFGIGGSEVLFALVVLVLLGLPAAVVAIVMLSSSRREARSRPPVVAGWYDDPSARHEQRYWDGREWTAIVSDGSVRSQDPLEPGARRARG